MKKKLLFIYNPRAGKAQIKNHLLDIIDVFVKAGYEVTAYPTQCAEDATRIVVDRAKDFDLVVCSGGDGTLDEVVAGMQISDKKLPIGYIPAGSTNDFARSLNIPFNMVEAAKIVVKGQKMSIDIGLFNNKTFVYVAAFGVFTDVTYQTEQDLKNALGHVAYVLEGMKSLQTVSTYHMRVEGTRLGTLDCGASKRKNHNDGASKSETLNDDASKSEIHSDEVFTVEDDFILGMVTNSLSVGGFSNLTDPDTELDDGVFEVLLIKNPQNLIEFNGVIASILNRDFSSPLLISFKASKITVTCDEPVSWTLDGEFGGQLESVEISNLNKAIEIMVSEE